MFSRREAERKRKNELKDLGASLTAAVYAWREPGFPFGTKDTGTTGEITMVYIVHNSRYQYQFPHCDHCTIVT